MIGIALFFALAFTIFVYWLCRMLGPGGWVQRKKSMVSRISGDPKPVSDKKSAPLLRRSYLSDIPFIEDLLRRNRAFADGISSSLKLTRLKMSVSLFLLISAVCGLFLFSLFKPIMGPASVLMAALGVSLPFLWLRMAKQIYINKFMENFPNALSMLSSSLKVGHVIEKGIDSIVHTSPYPVADEFRAVQGEVKLGISPQQALSNLYSRVTTPEVKMMVTGITINQEIGGNLSELLTNVEMTIRERFALQREVKALSAQGKFSAIALACIPIFIGWVSFTNNHDDFVAFFNSPIGHKCITAIVVSYLLALALILKIINLRD